MSALTFKERIAGIQQARDLMSAGKIPISDFVKERDCLISQVQREIGKIDFNNGLLRATREPKDSASWRKRSELEKNLSTLQELRTPLEQSVHQSFLRSVYGRSATPDVGVVRSSSSAEKPEEKSPNDRSASASSAKASGAPSSAEKLAEHPLSGFMKNYNAYPGF